jgi:hypothetical protein
MPQPSEPIDKKRKDVEIHVDLQSPKRGGEKLKENEASDAKLPHERDQSVDMTGGTPSREVQQAHRDVSRGLQDTSRAQETDRAYKKLKR